MTQFTTVFFINTAILISLAYMASLFYKFILNQSTPVVKYIGSVALAIFGGWVSSRFGYRFSETVIFDLRFVPLILSIFAFSNPLTVVLIGIGIGLTRFTFGVNEAAFAGFINLSLLGVAGAVLNVWFRRKTRLGMEWKGCLIILTVNLLNCVNISIFGVIPFETYWTKFVPITLPLGTVLTFGCALLFWGFYNEQERIGQLSSLNSRLSFKTRELEEAKLVLEERAMELQNASRYKSEFLTNMSHEFRTPLNGIINLAEILSDKDSDRTPEEVAQYGKLIHQSGHDLLYIVNDILDLAKVEAGRLDITKEHISVKDIAHQLHLQFEVTASQKNLVFEMLLSDDVPEIIESDSQRVHQILRNLLSNAFKFTNSGSVTLRVYTDRSARTKTELPHKGPWLVYSVEDTGIGVPEDQQDAIFEPFEQGHSSIGRKYGGTGLGLSISQNLAGLLGGFIEMESEAGTGSKVSLYLPF